MSDDRHAGRAQGLREGFGDFGGRVWLNCAHQGPLPLAAAVEAREAVDWKVSPSELTTERFGAVPRRLKRALGALIDVPDDDIILANGASYGIHLLANGIPLSPGDDILLMKGDFPSNILPWLALRERGVSVRLLEPERFVPTPAEIAANLTDNTRVVCLSWVHSFSGHMTDLAGIGEVCRDRGVRFIVNSTQGVGTRPFAPASLPIDAIVNAGWKWLCGPYATGFCWIRPELRERLTVNQAYWLSAQTADDLGAAESEPRVPEGRGAARYDVFGTANFFNFKPWAAAVEHLLGIGIEAVREHDMGLVARLIDGLDRSRLELLSPEEPEARTTLVFVTHRDPGANAGIYEAMKTQGVDIAFRRGRLRIAPHYYNTDADIDRALAALHDAAPDS